MTKQEIIDEVSYCCHQYFHLCILFNINSGQNKYFAAETVCGEFFLCDWRRALVHLRWAILWVLASLKCLFVSCSSWITLIPRLNSMAYSIDPNPSFQHFIPLLPTPFSHTSIQFLVKCISKTKMNTKDSIYWIKTLALLLALTTSLRVAWVPLKNMSQVLGV